MRNAAASTLALALFAPAALAAVQTPPSKPAASSSKITTPRSRQTASSQPTKTSLSKPASKPAPAPPLYPTRSTEPIVFIWPPEGLVLSAAGEFILGSVSPATAPFSINGIPVAVHPAGGFLAWVPIFPGTFTFRGELALPTGIATAERRILVPTPPAPPPAQGPFIDAASLSPRSDLELRAGDFLTARMKGSPALPARFRVGDGPWRGMREIYPGTYEGVHLVAADEDAEAAPVEYQLGKGWGSAVRAKGTARVALSNQAPLIATVKANSSGFANVKTGPANGFLLFPLPGTRLPVTGREGGSLRVKLSGSLSGWIEAKDVELASGPAPRAVTGTMSVVKTELGAALSVGLSEKAAFDVEPSAALDAVTVRLYHAVGHTNWVVNDVPETVKEVRWRQESSDTVAVTVLLQPGVALWGWWPSHDAAGFRLELRRAPKISADKPLSGIKVMLDPGHMPSAPGVLGPLGTKEMDANYAVAAAAKESLERAGATVLMTRADSLHEVSLVDRPRQAVERGADVFVSLHNNSMPDGENPFSKPRGFTVFYYHPQSLELGRGVHEALRERIKLPDEGLRWGNLLVARQSAMPAILVENAHMIVPDQEILLNDAAFRGELGATITAGLENFLSSVRRRAATAAPRSPLASAAPKQADARRP